MTKMSQAAVKKALDAHLLTFTGGGPIHVSGQTFEPTPGVPYLRADVPAYQRSPLGIGAHTATIAQGTYQIRVVRPAVEGASVALAMAARVAYHFRRGTALALETGPALNIQQATEVAMMEQGDWIVVPVIVSWFSTEG